MPSHPPRCRHLHTDGRQCGSPAVRHEKLCYQHLAATHRPSHTPTLPVPEDLHAVQQGLAELLHLVSRELVEDRQARRLFLILTAASSNLDRIGRARARDRELDLRQRALALAEARLASQHPAQHPAQLSAETSLSGCHSRRESASLPSPDQPVSPTSPEPGCPTSQEPGCPTFATVSPSLRWASSEPEPPVTDPVDDPELGLIAPGPDPEPRPDAEEPNRRPRTRRAPPSTRTTLRRGAPPSPQSHRG